MAKINILTNTEKTNLEEYMNRMNDATASQGTPRMGIILSELRCLRGLSIIFSSTDDTDAYIIAIKKQKRLKLVKYLANRG